MTGCHIDTYLVFPKRNPARSPPLRPYILTATYIYVFESASQDCAETTHVSLRSAAASPLKIDVRSTAPWKPRLKAHSLASLPRLVPSSCLLQVAKGLQGQQITASAVRHMRGHKLSPTCVALSPDDTTAFSGSKDNSILRWDIATGKRTAMLPHWRKLPGGKVPAVKAHSKEVSQPSRGIYPCSLSLKLLSKLEHAWWNYYHNFFVRRAVS